MEMHSRGALMLEMQRLYLHLSLSSAGMLFLCCSQFGFNRPAPRQQRRHDRDALWVGTEVTVMTTLCG